MLKNRKTKIILWILGFVVFFILALFLLFKFYLYSEIGKIKKVDIPKTNEELSISKDAINLDTEIINIALFGVDNWDNLKGRSDAIIIVSIDEKDDKIKLSSIMRDPYVAVEGYGMTKINHAYAYGGPTLAIKTLNSNFNLNIKDYASINFKGFEKLIDLTGGVELNIKSYELEAMKNVGIYSSGVYTLNGHQALEYASIRHEGNSDFERTDRQRFVLSLVLEKIKASGIINFPKIMDSIMPYLETSMSQGEILKLAKSMFTSNIDTIDQVRFPVDGYCKGEMIDGIYYLVIDIKVTAEQINKFIYDNKLPLDLTSAT